MLLHFTTRSPSVRGVLGGLRLLSDYHCPNIILFRAVQNIPYISKSICIIYRA